VIRRRRIDMAAFADRARRGYPCYVLVREGKTDMDMGKSIVTSQADDGMVPRVIHHAGASRFALGIGKPAAGSADAR
jgi:hypothetical protein